MDVAGTLENNEGLLIKYFNKCKTKIIAENTEIIVFAISSVFECIFLFKLCIGLTQDLKLVLMKNEVVLRKHKKI